MHPLFRINPKKYKLFAFCFQLLLFIIALVIVGQLIKLQIFEHNKLKNKAVQQRELSRTVYFRGDISDRNGITLASDATSFDLYAHPKYYEIDPKEIAKKLSPILKLPVEVLLEKFNKLNISTINIKKNIDRDTAKKIQKLGIRGLDLARKTERIYPQGTMASHILGYVNFDANLFAGVERTGSHNLVTFPKMKPIEYDGNGDIIYDFNTDPSYVAFPVTGQKLTLTIDSTIQHIAETELAKMVTKTKADRGTVIVMNPKNGEILGFAVLPSYNPNKYNKVNLSVIKNWVLSDVYPPGSTFKILTIASALQTKSITPYEKVLDTGKIKIGNWTISNHDYNEMGAPGWINLQQLFTHSSNVGALKISLKIPAQKHYDMLRLFGIGSKTGIDLPGESAGIIPDPGTWDVTKHASIGFGYSIAATPIQMASAVAAIANDGIWVTPHVIKYSKKDAAIKIKKRRVLSSQTSKTLTNILAASIQASDATSGKIPNYMVAGKTGTSKKPKANGGGYTANQVFTSFVGYFPIENPKVLIMVVVDNPKGCDIWGSTVAGPIFNAVATDVARILNIDPDAPGLNVKPQKTSHG